ncbi:Efflux pump FUS6 [Fusarium oxysporum f. sp. raphani]|uniref:Efflux pump FUS6 n=1 Tax=Fusarium oxysporum f. sp. raphani TaxID=96318 RepID=A0A8J5QB11_FUSOX|nr:Efflux pump FUS6 [Fusarium oxysporum f. sp. raphani]
MGGITQQDTTSPPDVHLPQSSGASNESKNEAAEGNTPNSNDEEAVAEFKPSFRFWIILANLSLLIFLATLENTIIGTALPFIVEDLKIGSNYVWVAHIQLLTGTSVLPLTAQLANIFGRRWVTIVVTSLFIVGCVMCGAATNEAMLLAGRGIQGVASQNCVMLTEMVISDLVPLRERSKYIGMTLSLAAFSLISGPIISGALVNNVSWRWVSYLLYQCPIAGVALVGLYLFLHVKWNRNETIMTKLRRIDWVGNIIITGSSISILLALTWAHVVYPWDSPEVLVPLIIGIIGVVAFFVWEAKWATEPVVPLRIFKHWSSILLYIETFMCNFCLFLPAYFLPLFFQGVMASSAGQTGVQMIPLTAFMMPSMIFTAVALPKVAKYKVFHVVGFSLLTVGQGIFSTLKREDSNAEWVFKLFVQPIGTGFLAGSTLPAIQSWTAEADMAAATAGFTYIRGMAMIFGIAIPSTIFNIFISKYSSRIDDPEVRALLNAGDAFALGSKDFVMSFDDPVQSQIRETFQLAIQKAFQPTIAFAGIGFVLACICRDNRLRSELETLYGLEEKRKKEGTVEEATNIRTTVEKVDGDK